MRKITFAQAINEAIREEMLKDEKVIFMGEDIGVYHQGRGPCGVSVGLLKEFGADRVIETPIAESVITGSAVGAAIFGLRPIVEIMHSEFMAHCFEHVFYSGSKAAVKMNGLAVPLVIRTPFGGVTPGELVQDENNEAWFGNSPGLKIVIPSTPYDAKGLMKSALRDNYPVLFLEHKGLYKTEGEVPEEEYSVPLGKAAVRREGKDLTVLTYGNMVRKSLSAAETLAGDGVDIEVIDLRTVLPLDEEEIIKSVSKTGRAVIFHEARKTGGMGGEIAAVISEKAFGALKAPILRVAGPNIPDNFPRGEADLIAGVKQVAAYKG
jgi:pyruvate dehydrogenase E1 component beta subunit